MSDKDSQIAELFAAPKQQTGAPTTENPKRLNHKKPKDGNKSKWRVFLIALKVVFKAIFLFTLSAILIVVFVALGMYIQYSAEFDSIKPESNSTQLVMYDKNGNEFFRGFGAAEPKRVSLADIPDVVKQATLSAEDTDFYQHGPIDLKGIARATYENWKTSDKQGFAKVKDLFNQDSYTQGGSTITQQLVKNIYLSPEKSWQRKIKELVFSYRLERKFSKDKILETYLNEIYYGEQALGIENASKVYFNKDVKDLDLSEASLLAGLPQAPTYYSPVNNFDAAQKRQEYVLNKMVYAGYISFDQAKEAANEPLSFSGKQETTDKSPFFSQFVKDELASYIGADEISDKGLKVYTSYDPDKQKIAEDAMKDQMKKLAYRGATNSASVIANPKTNEILAMVGGMDWNTSKVNVATSLRQPGSSFKPIVYATGLENGYTAGSIFNDKYVNFGGNPPYAPRNYSGGYSGYVSMRNALARSLNVPAVEMGSLVGLDKVVDMAHKLGITSLNDKPESYGLPLSLGSGEVQLADMVNVFSTFADGGKRMPNTAIKRVVNQRGEEINLPVRKKQQVLSPETAYIISSILSDNNARSATFGSYSPLKTDKTTAVKTGTTENYADSWTVGYSPNLVVGVWMGNNDHKPMKQVSGVEGAAYIWHDIMTNSLKDAQNLQFERPQGITEAWISPSNGSLADYKGAPNILEVFKAGTEPKGKLDLSYLNRF